MSAPDSLTQKWLRQNIHSYPNRDRVFLDIDAALARFPTLRPKSDVYTFDDGRTQLLLCIHGLLPISFKHASYNIPIAVWITREYPRHPPISYVVPTNDMLVKSGRYIDPSGRCYIEYIQQWERKAEGCNLAAMLESMQADFSRQPPVYSKPKSLDRPQRPSSTSDSPAPPSTLSTPPTLPPKPATPVTFNPSPHRSDSTSRPVAAPFPRSHHPTPPPPPSTIVLPPEHASLRTPQSAPPLPPHPPAAPALLYQSNPPAAVSAPRYPPNHEFRVPSVLPPAVSAPAPPPPPPPPPHLHPQGTALSPPFAHVNHALEASSNAAEPPRPLPNFLDEDSFDALPQLITRAESLPPRPPNPELLYLHVQVHEKVTSELGSLNQALALNAERLRAHQTDLLAGEPAIYDEMARLEAVRDVCLAVADKTRQVVQQAEANITELRRKGDPEVDELVCSTNIVHNQLINLVADDNAIEDTIYHLHRALNTGRIDLERFLRSTRLLAEEQFMKRALIDKIQAGIPMAVSMGSEWA
ncbi:UEV domain-containing protein [Cyathus striatus]|nr:UEV domain-containing protein [Cyathus striatus]